MAKNRRRKTAPVQRPAARASWSGMLRFGLVSIPVQAFNTRIPERGAVAFHQLHAECHSRIRYEKVCPIHGSVTNDEIISGYEYQRGQYVQIKPGELDALRTEAAKALTIDTFITSDEWDPVYFDGRMYYLAPNGAEAREPYAIFCEALERQKRFAIGQVVLSGREQLVLLRPEQDALYMAMLNYAAEIRDVADVTVVEAPTRSTSKEVRLAEQLIESYSEPHFDFSTYVDHYFEKVKELIAAKVEGREIVRPEAVEEPEVINMADALRKSLARAKPSKAKRAASHNGKAQRRKPRRAKSRRAS